MGLFGLFSNKKKETLDKGLEKTKESVFGKLARAVAGKSTVDDDVLDDLEEVLITSDVGVETTVKIIRRIEERVARDKYVSTSELNRILREEIASLLEENHTDDNENWDLPSDHKPYVILVVGVNGVGKTTTIGKLAYQFKKAGKKVYLGAADTFRAAAVEQICIWGERVGVPVVKQQMGSDPASVAFDTLQSAKANGADVVLIDTAGRLHNKVNLMNELKKIKEVMKKVMPEAPDEVMLVLDGSTGQNAFEQAKQFAAVTNISSLAHHIEQIERELVRISIVQTDPLHTRNIRHAAYEFGDVMLAVQVHAVVGELLGDDLEFLHTIGYQLAHLVEDFIHRTGNVLASDDRYGTIRTAAVATFRNLDIGIMMRSREMAGSTASRHISLAQFLEQLLIIKLTIKLIHLGHLSLQFLLVAL